MKSFRKSFKLIWVLLLVPILFVFFRCTFTNDLNKIQSSLDSVKIIYGTPVFKNLIHIEFLDAKTKLPVTGEIKVTVSGSGASKVYSNIGEQEYVYTAMNGMLDLALDPNIDSTYLEKNPVRFDITPQISGYLSLSMQVEVSHGLIKYVPVYLINISGGNTDGIKISNATLTPSYDATNKTTNPITQQIDGTNTTIEILPGTVLKDASGNPLTGKINSQVVFFSAADSATQDIIQNYLTGEIQLKDGSTTQSRLISAGMFSIRFTVGDKTVKTMDGNGLKISTRLAANLFNPDKNRVIQEGDTIPMWSKDDGSSKWILEKNTLVKRDNAGFYLEDVVNHLSLWNCDWYWYMYFYCYYGPRIIWRLSGFSGAYIYTSVNLTPFFSPYYYYLDYIYYGGYSYFNYFYQYGRGTLTFKELYPVFGRKLVFSPPSISYTSLCSPPVQIVNVTAVYDEIVTVNLILSARSTDPSNRILIRPNIYLYYMPINPYYYYYWNGMFMRIGITQIQVLIGHDYNILGCFGNSWVYGKLRVDNYGTNQLQVKLTPMINGSQVGSMITLNPVTRPSNNIINVNYTAILSPDVFNKIKK